MCFVSGKRNKLLAMGAHRLRARVYSCWNDHLILMDPCDLLVMSYGKKNVTVSTGLTSCDQGMGLDLQSRMFSKDHVHVLFRAITYLLAVLLHHPTQTAVLPDY